MLFESGDGWDLFVFHKCFLVIFRKPIMSDEATRATNDDATSCKKSAVDRGYWSDAYIKFFCRSADRKAPEINRGYYARVAGVQALLHQFLTVCVLK